MELEKTERGFDYAEFEDSYGAKCTLQKSSSAMAQKIWFGVHDVKPIIMASDAKKLGLRPSQDNGWVPFDVPKEVMLSSRMHLTQQNLHDLMPALTEFIDTGELEDGYDYDFSKDYESFTDDYEMEDFKEMTIELKESALRVKESISRIDERRKKLVNEASKILLAADNLTKFLTNRYENEE